ncbi:hypothetical protein [Natronomonas sp. EA1]|uniref:hypothetical protein n=1 Tax=Natronomonas sp. EA1 TaxID=3421655 RepID=UPI003EB762E4
MAIQMQHTEVRVACELRVPRGRMGDLGAGARTVLEKVDGVDRVTVREIDDVRPTAADIYVDVVAELDLADTAALDSLEDGFGVMRADRLDR